MATPKPSAEVLLKSQDALLSMQQYFRDIYAKRRQQPEDDLITALVQAELEGDKLTEEEMVSSCVTILIGGHETTTYLIANGMYALLQHPDQLRLLRDDPALDASATEEFLRYEGPFQRNRRIATRDVQIGDMNIREGQLIMQFLGAANRDPAQFSDPDTLDITRSPNKHLAFGYGPHFLCGRALGSPRSIDCNSRPIAETARHSIDQGQAGMEQRPVPRLEVAADPIRARLMNISAVKDLSCRRHPLQLDAGKGRDRCRHSWLGRGDQLARIAADRSGLPACRAICYRHGRAPH